VAAATLVRARVDSVPETKLRLLLVLAGLLTTMIVLGAVLVVVSVPVGRVASFLVPIVDLLLLVLGVLLIAGRNPFNRLPGLGVPIVRNPYGQAYVYGVMLGPIALPCAGPFLAAMLAVSDAQDVELLHAAAASLGLAIGHAKGDAAMLVRLPEVDALLARALVLDEGWNDGALHELAVSWRAARPGIVDRAAVDTHYARALALSRGTRAALFVAYAEAAAVREQDRVLFGSLLARALAVDAEARPQEQLQDALAKRRARWLAAHADRLFLE
jgi:predicted anti-sigma-YlaC factor YlaD